MFVEERTSSEVECTTELVLFRGQKESVQYVFSLKADGRISATATVEIAWRGFQHAHGYLCVLYCCSLLSYEQQEDAIRTVDVIPNATFANTAPASTRGTE